MDSPEHLKHEVREYLSGQMPDLVVEHLERVASERVFDGHHDVWDVHTSDGRWWVISDPMNYYPHNDFKSMDVALSFHIGLSRRVFARFTPPAPDGEVMRFPKSWRQVEQAHEALVSADEAEEFQAVGMRCRECLLTFARELATDRMMEGESERPKTADFKAWVALVARRIESREKPRSYLKAVANTVWDYVSWLTHPRDATRNDGHQAISATIQVVTTFGAAVGRWERGEPDRCPECGSYRLHFDVRWSDEGGGDEDGDDAELLSVSLCEACGWEDARPAPYEPVEDDGWRPSPIVEGECIGSDQISTFMSPQDFIDRHGE